MIKITLVFTLLITVLFRPEERDDAMYIEREL